MRQLANPVKCLCLAIVLVIAGCPAPVPPADTDPNKPVEQNGGADGLAGGAAADDQGAGDAGGASDSSDGVTTAPDDAEPNEPRDLSGEFSGGAQRIAPFRNKLTEDEAYHLLRRTSFGATRDDVDDAVTVGLAKTVDALIKGGSPPASVEALSESYDSDAEKRWLVYMLESPHPLRERVAMFWHDRFATSRRAGDDSRTRYLDVQHMQMLREHAIGNYREFLLELTLDPLMLLWLDGANSPKENPNENYAREFWELFTLGRDVLYTEDDIQQGALAFTGITLLYERDQNPRPIFDLYHHDNSNKMVFADRTDGVANYDYISLTDLTLAQPEAAEYVARNLFIAFVHDEPSDAVVQELAQIFVDADFDIAPLLRAILTSEAMFSERARGSLIMSPVEHIVSVARTLDMHMYSEDSQGYIFDRMTRDLAEAGQELLDPPGVEGWTEGEHWLSDQWLMARVEALGRTMEYGPDRTPDLPYHLLPGRSTWEEREAREKIVNAIARAFHLELTDDEIDIYVEVLDQNGHLAFHLLNPDQQPRHVAEMIRLMAMDERVITY